MKWSKKSSTYNAVGRIVCVALMVWAAGICVMPYAAMAAGAGKATVGVSATTSTSSQPDQSVGSLEAAATKAGQVGRNVAMSLIGLGFAIASIILVFRRDFKEAAGVFAVGLLAVLLATPAGLAVLHNTVNSLFGG